MTTQRKTYGPAIKAKVAIAAIKAEQTANEIGSLYRVAPAQVGKWKKQALEGLHRVFTDSRTKEAKAQREENELLLKKIGELTMDIEWLKKKSIGL